MFIRKKNFLREIHAARASMFRDCLSIIIARMNYYKPGRFPCGKKKDFVLEELEKVRKQLLEIGGTHDY